MLVLVVPFVNFHPLVWGLVADRLVEKTLTPAVLGMWLGIMLATYLAGLVMGDSSPRRASAIPSRRSIALPH